VSWQIYSPTSSFVLYLAESDISRRRYGNSVSPTEFTYGASGQIRHSSCSCLLLRFKAGPTWDVLAACLLSDGCLPDDTVADLRRPQYDTPRRSGVLYLTARQFGWTIPAYPTGLGISILRMHFFSHVLGLGCAWWIGTSDAHHPIAHRRWCLAVFFWVFFFFFFFFCFFFFFFFFFFWGAYLSFRSGEVHMAPGLTNFGH